MQTTLRSDLTLDGIGLHLGEPARVILRPAPADHGIVFRRVDLPGCPRVPARWDHVKAAPLNTRVESEAGVSVSTIEHLMAALAGCGIHNLLIDVDGPRFLFSMARPRASSADFCRRACRRSMRRCE